MATKSYRVTVRRMVEGAVWEIEVYVPSWKSASRLYAADRALACALTGLPVDCAATAGEVWGWLRREQGLQVHYTCRRSNEGYEHADC
jgi:hypothetical protein